MESILTQLKAIADGNRLRILMALQAAGELCPCQITELLQVSGATISRHLAALQRCGIVESRKVGKWVYFRLVENRQHQTLLDWVSERLRETEQITNDRESLAAILTCDPEEICRKQRGAECCPSPPEQEEGACRVTR